MRSPYLIYLTMTATEFIPSQCCIGRFIGVLHSGGLENIDHETFFITADFIDLMDIQMDIIYIEILQDITGGKFR